MKSSFTNPSFMERALSRFTFFQNVSKYCLAILFVSVWSGGSASAQITHLTWTGATNTDWDTPTNWSPNRRPSIFTTVTIPDRPNDPVISDAAVCSNLIVSSGAVLTITTGRFFAVYSSSTEITFLNQGTVVNNGDISINQVGNANYVTSNIGIKNEGVFDNNANGKVITNGTNVSLWNASGTYTNLGLLRLTGKTKCLLNEATFNNNTSGLILAGSNSSLYGIENLSGTFTNIGSIEVGPGYGGGTYGLKNNGTFHNSTAGKLLIVNVKSSGILNEGTFTNVATVSFGYPGQGYPTAITNEGTFENNAGSITIGRATSRGIVNKGSASFTNAATISIGETDQYGMPDHGIENGGTFNNTGGGNVEINYFTGYGIWNHGGTFSNEASVKVGVRDVTAGTRSIYNEAIFNNNTGGIIMADRSATYGIENAAGTFNNAATIHIGSSMAVGTYGLRNSATFNNNTDGVISINRATTEGINNVTGVITNYASIEIGSVTPVPALFNAAAGEFRNNTGGVLKGTGSINAAFFTNAGGILSPGYSPGIQNFTEDEDFSNSTLRLEITGAGGAAGTDFDQIAVNGPATFGSSTYLQLVFGYEVANGATFDLIAATSVTGTIPAGNISFSNTGAGNVTRVSVSYPTSNRMRITVSDQPLPVALVSFKAKTEGSVRQLWWETSMEKDNDYFEIQKSIDARDFSGIGQVKGAAAGFRTQHYNFTDREATAAGAVVYYRLKMVDLDGTFAYSSIVACRDESRPSSQAMVFPNPFSEYVKVKSIPGEMVTIGWDSIDGRSVKPAQQQLVPLSGEVLIKGLEGLVPGIYMLSVTSSAGKSVQKIVRQ